jgi:hypothetical protein
MSTIDLKAFSVPDDFTERLPTSPKVRAPRSVEDIFVHPEWAQPEVLLAKVGSKFWLVNSLLARALAGHVFRAKLFAMATSDGEVAVWPAKLDTSAVEAAEAAIGAWVRVTWQNTTKGYAVKEADQEHPEPDWRYADVQQLIAAAFAGQVLDNLEQAEVRKLLAANEASK